MSKQFKICLNIEYEMIDLVISTHTPDMLNHCVYVGCAGLNLRKKKLFASVVKKIHESLCNYEIQILYLICSKFRILAFPGCTVPKKKISKIR